MDSNEKQVVYQNSKCAINQLIIEACITLEMVLEACTMQKDVT
jgi:hypothetical protein